VRSGYNIFRTGTGTVWRVRNSEPLSGTGRASLVASVSVGRACLVASVGVGRACLVASVGVGRACRVGLVSLRQRSRCRCYGW
jgi:F0F1-type ATP synthase membrane subunit c/vacuolar-type H+-ATPase subunit K